MKKRLTIIMLSISFFSCAILKKQTVDLYCKTERIILEDEKYRLYLDENRVRQYLEGIHDKSNEDKKLLSLLKDTDDTLSIKKPANNFSLKGDCQIAIFPILCDFLKKGSCSIVDKQNNQFVRKLRIVSVNDKFVGRQVNFIINEDVIITHILSLGE
jgi:hypothetical protein